MLRFPNLIIHGKAAQAHITACQSSIDQLESSA